MSEYEFWDELGNIFNAIVAYQQKTIEFNKRFVNPWIRLGTVFDQNDHNAESLSANKKAIEIDEGNPTNWLSLGDVHFKMGALDDAAIAYRKAIELNPRLGWAYANLALIGATRQKYTEAINLYVRSLELLTDDKDRAMIWNRLGNTYRRVNDYENAFIAFQMADECDGQNTGFEDALDEVTVEQRVMPIVAEVYVNENAFTRPVVVEEQPAAESAEEQTSPAGNELVVEDVSIQAEDTTQTDSVVETVEEVAEVETTMASSDEAESPVAESPVVENQVVEVAEPEALAVEVVIDQLNEETAMSEAVVEQVEASPSAVEVEQPVSGDSVAMADADEEPQTVEAAAVEEQIETTTEPSAETSEVLEILLELVEKNLAEETTNDPDAESAESLVEEAVVEQAPMAENIPAQAEDTTFDVSADTTVTPVISHDVETFADPSALNAPVVLVVEDIAELIAQSDQSADAPAEKNAVEAEAEPEVQYEAIDAVELDEKAEVQPEPVVAEDAVVAEVQAHAEESNPVVESEAVAEVHTDATSEVSSEPVETETLAQDSNEPAYDTFLEESAEPVLVAEEPAVEFHKTELKVEPDTRNAHVWNELGNVYFNTGSYEEAITAYSKAIELDDWFAWPYSNLALVYVQKEKYAEAILLYQRSIELFSSDKDKAITWNRLGNVYRRLNDYDNAIVCYQRADELDPNNATRSLRSRFSLLGNMSMEQSTSLAV